MRLCKGVFALIAALVVSLAPAQAQQCTQQTCPWRYSVTQGYCAGMSNTEDNARQILNSAGIQVNSCPCAPGQASDCTEVGGLLFNTINGIILFKSNYGSPLILTGGSEDLPTVHGDTDYPYTHVNGYKVDIIDANGTSSLDTFIEKYFALLPSSFEVCHNKKGPNYGIALFIGVPFGGPCLTHEPSHWDVAFPGSSFTNLQIVRTGTGSGSVISDIGGINCSPSSSACSAVLTRGISASLTATPDSVSVFAGWTGAVPPDASTAAVFLDQTKTPTVEFDQQPPPPPGQGMCWTWISTLGYAWNGTCGNTPQRGGTQPPQGCWHWDATVNPLNLSPSQAGAWIFDPYCNNPINKLYLTGLNAIVLSSNDPNDKVGSNGSGSQRYVAPTALLRYAVFFSNLTTASAPAQQIVITDQLDVNSDDLATFNFGPISFPGQTVVPPSGLQDFTTTVDLRPSNDLLVLINTHLDPASGLVTWRFTSLDPTTNLPTTNPFGGFLAPGGEGSVVFAITPKSGVATNAQILNQASIVFDANAAMATQTWLDTVDATPPTSQVAALPATETSSTFNVRWSGSDVGAGIRDYTIFVSESGAPFFAFLTNTTMTSATFAGQPGQTYAFYSVARDLVGNVESRTAAAEATTSVPASLAPAITSAASATFPVNAAGSFTVVATGVPTPPLSETGSLPAGVMFLDNGDGTGTLSGTASSGGIFNLAFTAANGITPNATQNFTLTVGQAPAITSAVSTTFTVGTGGSFTVTATGAPTPTLAETATLPSGVTFNAATGVLTVTASTAPGTYALTFTATNGVSPNASQTFSLTVNQAPTITSASSATFQVGSAGSFSVTTAGFPASTLTETGALPNGVTFLNNGNGTSALSGIPTSGGTFPLTLTATNNVGTATQSFVLTVNQASAITSTNGATFQTGVAGAFTVVASGSPTPVLTETGALPAGITFADNHNGTGTLSGTPTGSGIFNVSFVATNNAGTATQSFRLAVDQSPAITSSNSATLLVGTAGSVTVTTIGFPVASIAEIGTLPAGVTFTNNANGTASLAGTPSSGGVFAISFTAANAIGTATQAFTLTVNQTPAFGSANRTTFQAGVANSFTVSAIGFPTPALTEVGALPVGVSFIDNHNGTATLSGIATTSGTSSITLTASNAVGTATQSFSLTVAGATQIRISPSSINFGDVFLLSLQSKTVTVQNVGTSPIAMGQPSITRGINTDKYDFNLVNSCGTTLAAGKQCTITVIEVADDVAATSATLNIADGAVGSPQQVSLAANVINPLVELSPRTVNFGTVKVGTGETNTVTLKNVGTTPLAINSIGVTGKNAADFTATPNCPSSLAPSANCAISLNFVPGAKGSRAAGLSVTDNARTHTQTVQLVGSGN